MIKFKLLDKKDERVRAMFRFDSRLPSLPSIFNKHWKTMIEEDSRLKPVCYSRGRNLREQLCTASLPPPRTNLRLQ